MKKVFMVLVFLVLLSGCGEKEEVPTNSNGSGSNYTETSNSNTNSNATEEDPDIGKYDVEFYLFHLSTCSHCHDEIEWLSSIKDDYPYLHIHYYEVNENNDVYEKVREALGITSGSVPLTIIGPDYYVGFSESKGRKFLRNIKEQSKSDICDVVGTIISDGDVSACISHNEEFYKEEDK